MSNLVGQLLGHFRIEAELGEGGMGVVYRATDEGLRRPVALKVLPESFAADVDRRRRFLREARSAAAVTHANLATVFEVGEADGRVFIAMELVLGETLRAHIDRGMAIDDAVRIGRDIARGMGRAHEKGIVHRDLKPENVMVTPRGEVKILDFGLAKVRAADAAEQVAIEQADTELNLTADGRVLGTPAYMSPEQAKGERVDARTDVFSFGVMFFEMLTRKRPFAGNTAIAVLLAATSDAPRRASDLNPEVWEELDRIIERCLAKKADDRYPEGDALADALQELADRSSSRRPRSHPVPPGDTAPPQGAASASGASVPLPARRRSRLSLWVFATALGFGVLGSAIVVLRPRAAPPPVPAAPVGSAPRPLAITEHPPPRTSIPEAAAAFAAGLQAYRDGSMARGLRDMEEAVDHDPHLAAAHVRLGLQFGGTSSDLREHNEAASQSRTQLDARDQELLSFLRAKAGIGDATKAARTLIERLPDDPEALMWAARYLNTQGLEAEAIPLLDRALVLDPAFAGAAHERAVSWSYLGDPDRLIAASEACLAIPPGAPSCVRRRGDAHNATGACEALARDGEQLLAMERDAFQNYSYVYAALASQGAPAPALASLARRAEGNAFGRFARELPYDDAARLGIYEGDFDAAEKGLLALSKDPDEDAKARGVAGLMWVYGEEGNTAKAAAVAETYLLELPAAPKQWDGEHNVRPPLTRSIALVALRAAGHRSADEARALRDGWIRDWRPVTPARLTGALWSWFYASAVVTPDDAREALEALPKFEPLPSSALNPQVQGAVGRVQLLVGDLDAALPLLRAEAARCGTVMPSVEQPDVGADVQELKDRALLGQILEKKGDAAGACAEYGKVLARWGHAKPRSVTADRVRALSKTLGCR